MNNSHMIEQEKSVLRWGGLPGDIDTPGDGQVPTLDTPYGQIGSVICFDLDWPYLSRQVARLVLSLNTIKTHARNIYSKLGVNNQMQAVAKARALGFLENESGAFHSLPPIKINPQGHPVGV